MALLRGLSPPHASDSLSCSCSRWRLRMDSPLLRAWDSFRLKFLFLLSLSFSSCRCCWVALRRLVSSQLKK